VVVVVLILDSLALACSTGDAVRLQGGGKFPTCVLNNVLLASISGNQDVYCGKGSCQAQYGLCSTTVNAPPVNPVSDDGRCGDSFGNTMCTGRGDFDNCCSIFK